MYTVLIVDDERIIRDGIVRMIPWMELCIGRVCTAAGSKEALTIAHEKKPDILITDICMDEMDGIELTRQMLRKIPELKVIVLTGYDDFKYAQQCCKLGVRDFILKPADETDLCRSIRLQVKRLQAERSCGHQPFDRKEMLDRQHEMENSIKQLTEPSADTTQDQLPAYRLPCDESQRFQVAVMTPIFPENSIWFKHRKLLWMSLKNLVLDFVDVENEGWSYQKSERYIVAIFFISSPYDGIKEKIRKIQELVNSEIDIDLDIRLGPVVEGMKEIRHSFVNASPISMQVRSEKSAYPQKFSGEPQDQLSRLKARVLEQSDGYEEMKEALKEFVDAIRAENLQKSTADTYFYSLACDFYWRYINMTGREPDGRLENLISTLKSSDFESCCVFIEIFLAKLILNDKKQMHETIRAATDFIHEHLTEDLTVFTLAKQFHVARSYFSRLFKKEMGEGCNDYITHKRIEKAKQLLLSTNLKTYEIAEQVGYHDTNYFSLAFKKNIGVSPTEFKYRICGD